MTDPLSAVHSATVHKRRVRRLATLLSALLPANARVLDVGCGDGQLGAMLLQLRTDLTLEGLDVLVRPHTRIAVREFDGRTLPMADDSVDVVLLIDVLHHCEVQVELLRECGRVARHSVTIKDHLVDGFLSWPLLRFMDWVGNAGHGVALPYNYWRKQQWQHTLASLGWSVDSWQQDLAIYPRAADWIFGRNLHFLARCRPASVQAAP
ncbi:MAG: class I SAM-dependent methyltransferase [Xanthomonadales bacterium]|nr:class I SAM-dependent methyltransferase [Xanthomonadales bacterium]